MFNVGDLIRQTHQVAALTRLVVELTDDPNIVVVYDRNDGGYRKVFVWGHTLVTPATMTSLDVVLTHQLSEAFIKTKSLPHW